MSSSSSSRSRVGSRLRVLSSPRFAEHVTPPGHPERLERAAVLEGAALAWQAAGGATLATRPASDEELRRVHAETYLAMLDATAGRPCALDADTYTSTESIAVAREAAGASLVGVEYAIAANAPAFALVRPPGHHAERDRAMGFCFYNNAALAAAHARARGCARVAVVDIDVHHGNGTQWIFYDDPSVLYVSLHQSPYYPGTGAVDEVGRGAGRGFTVNVPLAAGATDADYALVGDTIVDPVLRAFAPELVVVSAGFDAHERDPLGGMRVTTAGYAASMALLWQVATETCAGRLLAVTEGGYDLTALRACVDASIDVLASAPALAAGKGGDDRRAREAISRVRPHLTSFWPTL